MATNILEAPFVAPPGTTITKETTKEVIREKDVPVYRQEGYPAGTAEAKYTTYRFLPQQQQAYGPYTAGQVVSSVTTPTQIPVASMVPGVTREYTHSIETGQLPSQWGAAYYGPYYGQGESMWRRALGSLSIGFNTAKYRLGQVWDNLGTNVSTLGFDVSRGMGKVWGLLEQGAENRWRTLFNLPPSEQLLAEFQCRLLSGNTTLEGFVFISFNYLCFAPLISFANPASNQMLLISIPLRDIENILPAVVSPSYMPGIPTIQPVTNPLTRPDAFQIITRDHGVFNFFGYTNFTHTYNVLYHAWKAHDIFAQMPSQQLVQQLGTSFTQQAPINAPTFPTKKPVEQLFQQDNEQRAL